MLSSTVWLLGCSVKGQELDSVIQMALFQSSVFCDCVIVSAQKSATNGIFKAYYSHSFQAILCPGHPGTCQNLKPSYGCFPVHGKQSTKMSPNTESNLFTEAKIILDLSYPLFPHRFFHQIQKDPYTTLSWRSTVVVLFLRKQKYVLTLNLKFYWERAVPPIPAGKKKGTPADNEYRELDLRSPRWGSITHLQWGTAELKRLRRLRGPGSRNFPFILFSHIDDSELWSGCSGNKELRNIMRMFWLTHETDEEKETVWQYWWTSRVLHKRYIKGILKFPAISGQCQNLQTF